MHTVESVSAELKRNRESEEPDAILEALKPHNGKRFTVHVLRKLPGGEERWRWDPSYGMVHLEDRDHGLNEQYRRVKGGNPLRQLVAYANSGPDVVDAAWIEEHNGAYFAGRRERNASRDAQLGNPDALRSMADALNAYEAAKVQLDLAKWKLDKLTEHGESFAADRYDWERLCGAREEDKR